MVTEEKKAKLLNFLSTNEQAKEDLITLAMISARLQGNMEALELTSAEFMEIIEGFSKGNKVNVDELLKDFKIKIPTKDKGDKKGVRDFDGNWE